MIGKLLGLATMGGTLASVGILHRFLSGIASIIMLTIASAFMLCALLTGVFYLGYLGLVHTGLDPMTAALIVGGFALIITIALVTVTYMRLNKLRDLSHRELPSASPLSLDLGTITNAFLDGFLNYR